MEFENGLKERVRAAGLADRILFVGEHTNINEWYRALDLFISDPMKPGLMDRLFSTHPPIPQRIERLQRIGEGF